MKLLGTTIADAVSESAFRPHWNRAIEPGPLSIGDVAVWRVWVEQPARPDALARLLSAAEASRMSALRHPADRLRHAVSHAALRSVLACCLQVEPPAISISENTREKPRLARRPGWPDIRFSLAHTGEIALIAVTADAEVGVDVERVRQIPDAARVANRMLGPESADAITSAEPERRSFLFLRAWTRAEAFLKISEGS